MLKIKLGGLFLQPRAVHRALAPRNGPMPAVLDVGSGSGSWVLDMGELFPHAEVVGLDLAPANLPRYEIAGRNEVILRFNTAFGHAETPPQTVVSNAMMSTLA